MYAHLTSKFLHEDMFRGEGAVEEVEFIANLANEFDLAYLHVMRANFFGAQKGDVVTPARKTFKNALIVNMGYSAEEAEKGVTDGDYDAVAFGTKWLANPDLDKRFKLGKSLNDPKPEHFYTKVAEEYTDYPYLEE